MGTGRFSLRSPEYSPISSSVSEVRAISSRFHCRPATVLVTRISVVALASAIAAAPTSVLPAPQGSTTTPEPDRKSTRLNSSHANISYAVFCLKKKKDAADRAATLLDVSHADLTLAGAGFDQV